MYFFMYVHDVVIDSFVTNLMYMHDVVTNLMYVHDAVINSSSMEMKCMSMMLWQESSIRDVHIVSHDTQPWCSATFKINYHVSI
jgi:hypothetical protein